MNDTALHEYVAIPATGHGPGVLVLHAWWGLTGFVRQVCDRLAAAGLVALAPDLFDGAVATTVKQAEQLVAQAEGPATAARAEAGLDLLRQHPAVQGERLGVMGFSFGVPYALWLAGQRAGDVDAVVIFYGTGDVAPGPPLGRAPCLGHFAAQDPYEPAEGVQFLEGQLRAMGHPVTFHFYPGTGHWFFEEDRPEAYDPVAAELAWERTRAFLSEVLGAGGQ